MKRCAMMMLGGVCAAMLALPTTAQTTTNPDTKPAAAESDLPKAKDLLEKAIEAMGGRDAMEAVKSSHVEAKVAVMGMNVSISLYEGEDGKFYAKQSTPMGEQVSGSDGKTTWTKTPMGYQLLEGAMEEQARGSMTMFSPTMITALEEETTEMTTAGSEMFAGQDAWKVKTMDKDGSESFLYFSKQDQRPLGVSSEEAGPMGPMKVSMEMKEWKQFGDLTLFTVMEMKQGPQTMKVTFETIELNDVDDSKFELPTQVKDMVKDQPASQPATQPGR